MLRFIRRHALSVYAAMMLLVAVGYARWDVYMMDGDGTAFLDISQQVITGHLGAAINGYWNPAYPLLLALARKLTHPTLFRELAMARYVNVVILAFTMAACSFFTSSLLRLRRKKDTSFAFSDATLHLAGLAILLLSIEREIPIAAVRCDTLLLAFLLVLGGLIVRLQAGAGFWIYPVLGLTMGLGYFVKSFMLTAALPILLALIVIGLRSKGAVRTRMVGGAVLAALLFAAMLVPYTRGVQRKVGHFTTGDSALLNYAVFIDGMGWWHEWYYHDLGHATGTFHHAEAVIAESPTVFSYTAHAEGTFPLWYDPAYWLDGLKTRFYLKGHIVRLVRETALFVRYVLGRPELLILLAVLLAFGAAWPKRSAWKLWAPVFAWGLLMFSIYYLIAIQDRYLTAPLMVTLLSIFAWMGSRSTDDSARTLTDALIAFFAVAVLFQGITYIAEQRRQEQAQPAVAGYSPQMNPAAAALIQLGLQPGDKVACMGDVTCYTDHYWARLAGTQILAQVETKDGADPQTVWDAIPDKRTVTVQLQKLGMKFIVSRMANTAQKPEGWVRLGKTDFFAYSLR